jgi:pyochelin biosynthesis protein PchC
VTVNGHRYASGRWLRSAFPRPQARVTLFAFPHAGGSATFFRTWGRALPPDVETVGVQYPGRLDRLREPCIEDVHEMADALLPALNGRLDREFALFGHSLGAIVAYETARRLEARGIVPSALFLSSRPAPGVPERHTLDNLADDALVEELRRLGATPAELIEKSEMLDAILTSLRSDYRAVHRYQPRPGPPLTCPVVALLGDADPDVDAGEMKPWANLTTGPMTLHELSGDHFYLVPQRDAVLDIVATQLHRRAE